MDPPRVAAAEPAPPPHGTKAEPPAPPAGDDSVPVNHLVISQGSVSYAGGGKPVALDDIDAELSIGGKSGPFRAEGKALLAGTKLSFDAAMDRVSPGRGSPATLALRLPGDDARIDFNGLVTQLSGGETLRGRLTIAAPDLPRTLERLGVAAPLPAATSLAVDSEISASAEEAAASNLTAQLGDARATGSVTAKLGDKTQVDARLAVAALDLDKWQKPAGKPAAAPAKPSGGDKPAAAPAAKPDVGGFALPEGLFATAELSVETLSWRGQVVREAQVEAALDHGELMIRKASAQLPGGATLTADGTLATEKGRPVFDGNARLRSDNLRALLAWAGAEPASIPEQRLRSLDFASPIHVAWPEVRLSDVKLKLDASSVRGALTASLGDRPAFGLDANVDSVDVDSYRSSTKPAKAEAASSEVKPAPSPAPQPAPAQQPLKELAAFDAEVKLAVGHLVVNQVAADQVRLDGLLQNGELTLRQLSSGNLGGAQFRAQGKVQGLADNSPRFENLTVQVASPQPARLMRFFGAGAPAVLERLGPLNAAATANGTAEHLALDAHAEAGGLELAAKGEMAQVLTAPSLRMDVQAHHANTAQVIRLFSPNYRPQGTLGAFALDGRLMADGRAAAFENLSVSAGAAKLAGQLRAELGGAKPQITADLAGNALALDPFLAAERAGSLMPGNPRVPPIATPDSPQAIPAGMGAPPGSPFSREPLDLSALDGFDARIGLRAEQVSAKGWRLDQPVAQLAVLNGTASIDSLTGKLLGGDMKLAAKLAAGGAVQGNVSVMGADLGAAKLGGGTISVTQGKFNLDARFATSGRSTQDMASRLAGDGRILVSNGMVEGFDLPAVNQRLNNIENVGSLLGVVQAGLSGGKTPFSQLAGTFKAENGVVTSRDLKLDAQGGGGTCETVNDLGRWTTQTRINFALANAPNTPLGIRFEGPLDNPRKILDANALQQYLVSKGLGRAFKGKDAESVLQGLFGKGGQQQQPAPEGEPQPQQPQQKNSGKAILQDLFKGLGGR